jgi:hypothetical protein
MHSCSYWIPPEGRQRRPAEAFTPDHLLLLAAGTLWRALPDVLVPECSRSARVLYGRYFLSAFGFSPAAVRRHYLSVHYGSPVGSLGSSSRETARTAWRKLRSKGQARSAPRSSMATVPKQVCGPWWPAGPLVSLEGCPAGCGLDGAQGLELRMGVNSKTPTLIRR